jgi:hypothetical protein
MRPGSAHSVIERTVCVHARSRISVPEMFRTLTADGGFGAGLEIESRGVQPVLFSNAGERDPATCALNASMTATT